MSGLSPFHSSVVLSLMTSLLYLEFQVFKTNELSPSILFHFVLKRTLYLTGGLLCPVLYSPANQKKTRHWVLVKTCCLFHREIDGMVYEGAVKAKAPYNEAKKKGENTSKVAAQ